MLVAENKKYIDDYTEIDQKTRPSVHDTIHDKPFLTSPRTIACKNEGATTSTMSGCKRSNICAAE